MNRRFWARFSVLILTLVIPQAGVYLLLDQFGIARQAYSTLIISLVFLVACVASIRLLGMSSQDVHLKLVRLLLKLHLVLGLGVFCLYLFYYLLGVRISELLSLHTCRNLGPPYDMLTVVASRGAYSPPVA